MTSTPLIPSFIGLSHFKWLSIEMASESDSFFLFPVLHSWMLCTHRRVNMATW